MSLIELAVSSILVAITLSGSGWLLQAEWQRGRCAYLVFEKAHGRLVGAPASPLGDGPGTRIVISEDSSSVRGDGQCQDAHEQTGFNKLENDPTPMSTGDGPNDS